MKKMNLIPLAMSLLISTQVFAQCQCTKLDGATVVQVEQCIQQQLSDPQFDAPVKDIIRGMDRLHFMIREYSVKPIFKSFETSTKELESAYTLNSTAFETVRTNLNHLQKNKENLIALQNQFLVLQQAQQDMIDNNPGDKDFVGQFSAINQSTRWVAGFSQDAIDHLNQIDALLSNHEETNKDRAHDIWNEINTMGQQLEF
jgi:hypothetical protein